MNDSELQNAIHIMQARFDGKQIEYRYKDETTWRPCIPEWNWKDCHYRVQPATPDSINWSHVAEEWKFMARDRNGNAHLYQNKPWISAGDEWDFTQWRIRTELFASYIKGDCDWKDSLVERPEGE